MVELTDYPGMVHPFFSMGGAVDAGRRAMTQAAGTLKLAFGGHGVGASPAEQSRLAP